MKAERSTPQTYVTVDGKEAVTYAELLSLAHEAGLKGVRTELLVTPNDGNGRLAIVKATIEIEIGRFEAIGDADPGNVEVFLVPHLIRVAETRAKARALRDAVNCGVVSFEELDGRDQRPGASDPGSGVPTRSRHSNGSDRRGTPLRAARQSESSKDGPISDAQRRYLFRLAAGRGYAGGRGEEFLKDRLNVSRLSDASRAEASALIDELVHSAPERGAGNGATAPEH